MKAQAEKNLACGTPLFDGGDAVFGRIADRFDRHPLSFWSLLGQRLVELARLEPGHQVLDVGSGTGAVSIPAANAVHPGGSVLGIDIAQGMVDVAGRRARDAGVPRVSFHCADAAAFSGTRRLDAILGGFSLFFIEDMRAALERFRTWMKPRSTWAFSFWSQQPFTPLGDMLLEDLTAELPELPREIAAFRQRYASPDKLADLFSGFGGSVSLVSELRHFPVATAEQWWTLATHTGMRSFVDRIDPAGLESFKRRHFLRIEERFGRNAFLTVDLPTQYVIVRFDY